MKPDPYFPPITPQKPESLHLVTDFEYNSSGDLTATIGPEEELSMNGTMRSIRKVAWRLYDAVTNTVVEAFGYVDSANREAACIYNPLKITRYAHSDYGLLEVKGAIIEEILTVRHSCDCNSENSRPHCELPLMTCGAIGSSEQFPQSNWVRWKTNHFEYGLISKSRTYFAIPTIGVGVEGLHYAETVYGHDEFGRQTYIRRPGGTVTAKVYSDLPDSDARIVEKYVGTTGTLSDPLIGNMRKIGHRIYDISDNLVEKAYFPTDSSLRLTSYKYTFDNRLEEIRRPKNPGSDPELGTYVHYERNLLGHVKQADAFVNSTPALLFSRSTRKIDRAGRLFRRDIFSVSEGEVGSFIAEQLWFDSVGNIIQSRPLTSAGYLKSVYDALNRCTTRYSTCASGASNPYSVLEDCVVEETHYHYSRGGSITQEVAKKRFHDTPEEDTGPLGSPDTAPKARVSYVCFYTDGIGRTVSETDFGAKIGLFLRPELPPKTSPTTPTRTSVFNARGELFFRKFANGSFSYSKFDDAGRLIETEAGLNDPRDGVESLAYRYTPDNLLSELSIRKEGVENVTKWLYGTILSPSGSGIARADLVREKSFPGSSNDRVEFTYNALGEVVSKTDQAGVVHAYVYDERGRITLNSLSTGSVRATANVYDDFGRLSRVLSLATPESETPVNEVQFRYNGFHQIAQEFQEHSGGVTEDTPVVCYEYSPGNSGSVVTGNSIRLEAIRYPISLPYPAGRKIAFRYTGLLDSAFDRVSTIEDVTNDPSVITLVQYSWLGLRTPVLTQYGLTAGVPRFAMTAISADPPGGDAGDQYTSIDRFGRLEEARWIETVGGADRERIEYGYDEENLPRWRRNREAESELFDEAYTYDARGFLTGRSRGKLNQTRTAIGGNPVEDETWVNDPAGNVLAYNRNSPDGDSAQSRGFNPANQLVSFNNDTYSVGVDPLGNTTRIPKVGDAGNAQLLDWNGRSQLVQISDLTSGVPSLVVNYTYDGLGRRISKVFPSGDEEHFIYGPASQILESRNENGALTKQFLWGVKRLDNLAVRDEYNASTGALIRRCWAIDDGKNVTGIVGLDGSQYRIIQRYVYRAYGEPQPFSRTFVPNADSGLTWEFRYSGYFYDVESGLYFARNRFLHPTLGRWLSRDPIGEYGGANLYAYTKNQPLALRDPLGLLVPTPPPDPGTIEALTKALRALQCATAADAATPDPSDLAWPKYAAYALAYGSLIGAIALCGRPENDLIIFPWEDPPIELEPIYVYDDWSDPDSDPDDNPQDPDGDGDHTPDPDSDPQGDTDETKKDDKEKKKDKKRKPTPPPNSGDTLCVNTYDPSKDNEQSTVGGTYCIYICGGWEQCGKGFVGSCPETLMRSELDDDSCFELRP